MIQPHLVGRGSHIAQRGISNIRCIGTDQNIAIQRKISTSGKAVTVNLGYRWLMHIEQSTQASLKSLNIPGIIIKTNPPATHHTII